MPTSSNRPARERLIVALDYPTPAEGLALVDRLGESVLFYKIGWRTIVETGLPFVEQVLGRSKQVFLDLKMDDIEQTVEDTVRIIGSRAHLLTIQGGPATARAAARGRTANGPKILQVTMLSSQNAEDIANAGTTLEEYVVRRARRSIENGCDGVIASGESIGWVRKAFGRERLIVSPGIRPSGTATNDHKRSATPAEAIRMGADYLVVGRPILQAQDPVAMVESIVEEIATAADSVA